MISVTRLNGSRFVINCELIRTIEERPDTTIVLTTGDTVIVREKMDDVVAKAVEYGRMVRMFRPVDGKRPADVGGAFRTGQQGLGPRKFDAPQQPGIDGQARRAAQTAGAVPGRCARPVRPSG